MRRLYVVAFALLLAGSGRGQWLEKNLWLPDSMTGVRSSSRILFNPFNHHAYIDGVGLQIFDYTTRTKAGYIRSVSDVTCMFLCPDRQRVVVAGSYDSRLFSLDALTDSVRASIQVGYWPLCGVYNPVVHRAYVGGLDTVLFVFDPGPDTLIGRIELADEVFRMAFDSATNRLFAMAWDGSPHGIKVIDCFGDTLVGVLPTMDDYCDDLAFDPATRRLYCEGASRTTRRPEVWVYDVDSMVLLDTIALPENWGGINRSVLLNPGAGRLYVVCDFNALDDTGDTVAVIDCATNRIRGHIGLKQVSEVTDMALNPANNKVYISGWGLDSVAVLGVPDSITNWVRTGVSVSCTGWNPENDELLMAGRDDVLNVVSGLNDSIVARVSYGGFAPKSLAWNPAGDKLYAFDRHGVMIVDGQNSIVKTVCTESDFSATVPAFSSELNRFYIPSYRHDSLVVFDCNSDTVLRTSQLPFPSSYPAFTVPAHHKVYLPGYNDTVAVYDTYLDSVVGVKGGLGTGFVYNPRTGLVYGITESDERVRLIDPRSDTVIRRIYTLLVSCLAANPTDNELYAGASFDSVVYIVDCATNTVVDTVSLPQFPQALSWYEPLDKLYVYGDSAVMVVDCRTRAVTRVIPVVMPRAGVFAARNDKLWLGSADSMYVVSCRLDSIVATFPGGPTADLAWNPVDNRVYAASSNLLRIYRDDMTGFEAEATEVPVRFSLRPVSNPVAGAARFECGLPGTEPGLLRVFDATGRQVWTGSFATGNHVVWPGTDRQGRRISAGVYLARLESDGSHATAKVVLR